MGNAQAPQVRQPLSMQRRVAVETWDTIVSMVSKNKELCKRRIIQALLGTACFAGNEALMQKALGDGADINEACFLRTGGMGGLGTAAHIAASTGNTKMLSALFAVDGIDKNKGDVGVDGNLYHLAIANKHPDVIKVLIEHGADINLISCRGHTACMVAAMAGDMEGLRALAKSPELNVNVVGYSPQGPPMAALDLAMAPEVVAYLRDTLGAKRAADLGATPQSGAAGLGGMFSHLFAQGPDAVENRHASGLDENGGMSITFGDMIARAVQTGQINKLKGPLGLTPEQIAAVVRVPDLEETCEDTEAGKPPSIKTMKKALSAAGVSIKGITEKAELVAVYEQHCSGNDKRCARCGADGKLVRCGRCRAAFYCGRACQRAHWEPSHRHTCRPHNPEAAGENSCGFNPIEFGAGGGASPNRDMCAICLEAFSGKGEAAIQPLACNHRFHAACITTLQRSGIASSLVCPMCRKDLPVSVDKLVADAWTLETRADRGKLGGAEQKALMAKAEAKLREALKRAPKNITVLKGLAKRLNGRGRHGEAEQLLYRVLEVHESKLGPKHTTTLIACQDVATMLYHQGQLNSAEKLFRRAWKGLTAAKHESAPNALNGLANVLMGMGELGEAEKLLHDMLARVDEMSNELERKDVAPRTITLVNTLANVLWKQNKTREALPLFRRALAANKALRGDDHPVTLIASVNLAGLLMDMGQAEEAEKLFRRVVERREARSGPNHPDTVLAVSHWGNALMRLHRYKDALPLLRRALAGCDANMHHGLCRNKRDEIKEALEFCETVSEHLAGKTPDEICKLLAAFKEEEEESEPSS